MANIPQKTMTYNGLDDIYTFPQTAQNLIPYPYAAASGTSSGIDRTVNADGSVTVDGTATAAAYFYTTNASSLVKLQAGTYRLDGCPSGGGSGTYRLQIGHYASGTFTSYGYDSGDGFDFTVTDANEDDYIGIRIAVSSGATVSNLTFYPQLTLTAPYDWQSPVDSLVSRAHNALTEAPVQSVNGQTGAVALDADDVGAEPAVTEVTISTAGAVTQALDAGKIYRFTGAVSALTLTLNAASGVAQYHFDFDSGSTATTLTLPNSVTMPDGFSVEANKHYEVDILNGYGAVMAWAIA